MSGIQAISQHTGIVMPMDRANVDTDSIIPKQYLKSIKRTGFGETLFDDWRYTTPGTLGDDHSKRQKNKDFVMNQARYQNASILLARDNFACGSSREHAVWALLQAGFRAVIAPSYADIFYANANRNGLLAIVLPVDVVNLLFQRVEANEGYQLTVDLEKMEVRDAGEKTGDDAWSFTMAEDKRAALMQGFDAIDLTLQKADAIRRYEDKRRAEAPWLFADVADQ